MVNPKKHEGNLNNEDVEQIYDRLNLEYARNRDYNKKKEINQQLIILILLSRRFPVDELVRIDYKYFNTETENSILYRHLQEQITKKYCEIKGPLLTNRQKEAYTTEDIEQLLAKINTKDTKKKITVNGLHLTKSKLNDNGKIYFNKKKIKQYLKQEEQLNNILNKQEKQADLTPIEELEIFKDINQKLDVIEEKQDIIEGSLTNKYNLLENTIKKIHKNTKPSNKRYEKLYDKLNTIINPKQLSKIEKHMDEMKNVEDEKYQKIEEKLKIIEKRIEEKPSANDNEEEYTMEIPENKFKEFTYRWFSTNIKITKSTRDALDLEKIREKLEKYIDEKQVKLNKNALFNRLESYLKVWYNSKSDNDFKMIQSQGISGKEFYTNLRLIDFTEERENKIKNIIIKWLKEHTREEKGSSTYTKDLFLKIAPLFERNGWIITDKKEAKQLQEAGIEKVCISRTFSQLIGKALLEVYKNLETERDNNVKDGYITWYPNLTIIDKQISEDLEKRINYELSDTLFNTNNIIYDLLEKTLQYTGKEDDKVGLERIREKLENTLLEKEIRIKRQTLEKVLKPMLSIYLEKYDLEYDGQEELHHFTVPEDKRAEIIIEKWTAEHLVTTDNTQDKTYLEDIRDRLVNRLRKENISVINDNIYTQIQESIRNNFIKETDFNRKVEKSLKNRKYGNDAVNGVYYIQTKIIEHHKLKKEHIINWVNKNIDKILKSHAEPKEKVTQAFHEYMEKNNIKNYTPHTIEKLTDTAIREYYQKKNRKNLITDAIIADKEYYVLQNSC